MRTTTTRLARHVGPLGICLVFLLALEPVRAQSNAPWQTRTPAQLSAIWWQWLLGLPVSQNPAFDATGAKALNGQPYPDLVFLCGTFTTTIDENNNVVGEANRSITLKQGTGLFFPLINFEWDNVGARPGRLGAGIGAPGGALSVQELKAIVNEAANSVSGQFSTLAKGGSTSQLPNARLQSPVFSYKMPATDNLYQFFGINVSGAIAPAVADGFWTLIPPGTLTPGEYVLRFGGQVPGFSQTIEYHITVTP